ncbi:hypothetical protein CAP35_13390 [Chitinophagaceae bacterium IBVUCB1]|nr:hypothetical protein CAP35_13390 [Chitinophagaceae bacterium IBVUCB1]
MKHINKWLMLLWLHFLCIATVNADAAEVNTALAAAPLRFVQNKGQIADQFGKYRNDIDFVVKAKSLNLYISSNGLHYQWNKGNKETPQVESYRIDMQLIGAKTTAPITADMQTYYERYYGPGYSNDGLVVRSYRRVIYRNVYPNIDWVLYADDKGQQLKYDFVVHKGGNVADIRIAYNGAETITIEEGQLKIKGPMGTITEAVPYTYYEASKETVSSAYTLNGNILSFNTADATPQQTLIIDPSLDWSTYFGGFNVECAYAVSSDTAGHSYLVGHSTSSAGIATIGAYQTIYSANKDAYIACFDSSGSLLWATYYGGSNSDNFFYVTTDTLGGVYAAGITATTTGMSSTGAHQSTFGGGVSDAYMVKFDATGARIWATYFGGSGDEATTASFDDYMVSITWDKATNKVYLCGMTTSSSGIATTGAHQTTIGGMQDGYLAQFNTAGVLQWATYYGGAGDDKIVKMSADTAGSVYVTGITSSSANISTSGAHQTAPAGGVDAFVAKFSTSGVRQWGTYYGGSNDDGSSGIANDRTGNVYIAGATTSTSGISTTGSFQPSIAGSGPTDAFLIKFNPSGVRQWGTYLGGISPDNTSDIAIDGNNNICFSGTTGSVGIATPGAYQSTFGGNSDAYLAVFGPQGTRTWVSYIGGSDADNGFGISYSRTGDLFIAGNSGSLTGIASPGSHQMALSGSQDGYLAKFKADTSAYVTSILPVSVCQGDSITVNYAITNPFLSGNVFTVQLSDQFGSFGTTTTLGTKTTNLPGSIRVRIPETVAAGTLYRIRLVYSAPTGTGYGSSENLTIRLKPVKPAATSNSPVCSGNMFAFTAASTTPNVTYNWVGPNGFTSSSQTEFITPAPTNVSGKYVVTATLSGCISKDSFIAQIDSTPVLPILTSNGPNICGGNTIVLTASSATAGVNYTWVGPSGFSSTLQNPAITSATTANTGKYVATAKLGNCSSKDSLIITVFTTLTPDVNAVINPSANICLGDMVTFTAAATGGGTSPTLQWYLNGMTISGANSNVWTSNALTTGDVVFCTYTANWPCLTKPGDTSNSFTINALGNVPPTAAITASPGLNVPTGTAITFTVANSTNMGATPTYRWMKNGSLVMTGSMPAYIATVDRDIRTGDQITVIMYSSLVCAEPDSAISNTLTIGANIQLGVGEINTAGDWQLYPNPNDGKFTLQTNKATKASYDIDITDALGRVVYRDKLLNKNGSIAHSIQTNNLPAGVYLLRIQDGDTAGYLRFSVVH